MFRRRVAVALAGELRLLQGRVGGHALVAVGLCQLEHSVVQRVEARQRDELELVPQSPQLTLELGDRRVVQMLLPVERRRTVVREQLAGELGVDPVGEPLRLVKIRSRGLAPDGVGVRGVRETAGDRHLDAAVDPVEPLGRAVARAERLVARVDVGGEELRAVGVGASDDERRDVHDVGRQARGDQRAHELARRHENLPAEVTAFLLGGELVLEVNAGGAGLDHRLHQFEGVQGPAESSLGVGDKGRHPGALHAAFGVLDLVGAEQGLVDPAHEARDRVRGVEALVRVGHSGRVRVGGDLPTGDVHRLETGLHHLHRLVAAQRAQGLHVLARVQQLPQSAGAQARKRVLDPHAATQSLHVILGVGALDAAEAIGGGIRVRVGHGVSSKIRRARARMRGRSGIPRTSAGR